jgi:hypothetical protein
MCGGGGNGALLGAVVGAAAAYMTGGASLGLSAGAAAAGGGAAGALAGDTLIDQPANMAKQGLEQQAKANDTAIKAASKQAEMADQAMNRANPKEADIMGMLDANKTQAKGGQSGTMLTGPQGVDPTSLLLSKKTLLGA